MSPATIAADPGVPLLVLITVGDAQRTRIADHFESIEASDAASLEALTVERAARVRCVLTNGAVGIDAATIARLPALELICVLGAGYENVALDTARERGIAVTTGVGTNEDCVADHAWALLLASVRRIPRLDLATREGLWRDDLPLQDNVSGKRLGIVGLGRIGRKIARRGEAFDCAIGYHNRRHVADVGYRYFDSVDALATWSDYLVIAAPGGAATRHLIDANVLRALGPHGYLVNIARGSLVDTAALSIALRTDVIAGAGLDVYEGEPRPPAALLDLDNVVLTPHVGGRSPEAVNASFTLFIDNARLHFAGQALLTPL
jgi:lactate dehydrogenase-like 2-hydroxyacid dehydrogenase